MRELSAAALAAMNDQDNNNEVWLVLLQIQSPYITGGNICIVNNMEPITSNSTEYQPWAFTVTPLPDTDDQDNPTVQFTVDNVDQSIVAAMINIPIDQPPTLFVQVCLASQPDTIELEYYLLVQDVEADADKVVCTVGLPKVFAENFPGYCLTPKNSASLFPIRNYPAWWL